MSRVEEFASECKYLLGIVVDGLTEISQGDGAARAFVEGRAEGLFELFDLRADGGLRRPEFFRRPRDAALAGDGMKIPQVVIVKPFRRGCFEFHKN